MFPKSRYPLVLYRVVSALIAFVCAIRLSVPAGYMLSAGPTSNEIVSHCHSQAFGKGRDIHEAFYASSDSSQDSSKETDDTSQEDPSEKDCGYKSTSVPTGWFYRTELLSVVTNHGFAVPLDFCQVFTPGRSLLVKTPRAPPVLSSLSI